MKIGVGDKLVMIGDSITDADRARPIGEGLGGALGRGYVSYVDALLGTVYAERMIRVVNMGSSGNTVRDLKDRWETDVLALRPDWLSIMIGDNDVWRQFDMPWQKEIHVLPDEYEKTMDELVRKVRPSVKGLALMTPFYIESNPKDAMRARMDEYGAIVKQLAIRHDTLFIDTQAAFNEALKTYYAATLGWDRVHPTHIGNMILARAFLKSIEFEW